MEDNHGQKKGESLTCMLCFQRLLGKRFGNFRPTIPTYNSDNKDTKVPKLITLTN